jgi:pimeloyl-ACP methyl ester carboxylesterase
MSTFRFRGHDVYYRREGSGPPMVFLHNGGTSHRIWEPLLERYRADHDVIAVDMLGFGRSAHPDIEYSLDLYAEMLDALIEELGLEDVTLVGNCMGGATVLREAAARPERVRAVVAINVLTDHTADRGVLRPLLTLARRSARASRALGTLAGRLPMPRPVARAAARHTYLARPERVDPELIAHLGEANRDPDQARVLLSLGRQIDSFAPRPRAADAPPLCLVWGADNRVLPARDSDALRQLLAPERDEVIDDGGHLVMLDRPDAVAAVIDDFLASLPSSS